MAHAAITYEKDPLLTVYIDRDDPTSHVSYQYEDGAEQSTPFRTADLPMRDQAAATMVSNWIDGTDATLGSQFADAIGHDTYQRLLDEQWLPFQGHWHLSMRTEDAIAREVANAREFLAGLDLDDDNPTT